MRHIREVDAAYQTVILMQPENEIGMLPSARDYSSSANQKFKEEVPRESINYLEKNKKKLNPEFQELWKNTGYKTKVGWE